jgi:hypothetical protein
MKNDTRWDVVTVSVILLVIAVILFFLMLTFAGHPYPIPGE